MVQPLHYYDHLKKENIRFINSHFYNEGDRNSLNIHSVEAEYAHDAAMVNGYEILNRYFEPVVCSNKKLFAFGEDVGQIGDVNQGFAGLQEKHREAAHF